MTYYNRLKHNVPNTSKMMYLGNGNNNNSSKLLSR